MLIELIWVIVLGLMGWSVAQSLAFFRAAATYGLDQERYRFFRTVAFFLFEPCITLPLFGMLAFLYRMPATVQADSVSWLSMWLVTPWVLFALVLWPWINALRVSGALRQELYSLGRLGLARAGLFTLIAVTGPIVTDLEHYLPWVPIIVVVGMLIGGCGLVVSCLWLPYLVEHYLPRESAHGLGSPIAYGEQRRR